MRAAVLFGPRDLRVVDVDRPSPPRGWALVRSVAVGICGTDKAFYRGSYPLFKRPLIPGHEVSGVVVEGPDDLVGASVVSEINFACGECPLCRAGLYTHCPHRRTLGIDFDGGMAEYFIAPAGALHVHGMPHERAFAAEPLAAVLNAFSQEPPREGWSVAILGTGFIALLAAQVLRLRGFEPVIVAREGSRKAGRLRSMGFRVVGFEEAVEIGRSETWSGLGFDMVFEATGSNEGVRLAVKLARPRGVVHLKSTPGGEAPLPLTEAVVKELRLIGTRCGTFREFREALKLLSSGAVEPVVDASYPLEDAVEAFERSLEGDTFRVIVKP
ncbi:MAG: alcohol dehydrogenase catalytic domain-containing protein [Desulfurococcales archaeon]|nr:alcohol dehydrogenase catalytic domain-containing protein [Desulfurococcales archaeon]